MVSCKDGLVYLDRKFHDSLMHNAFVCLSLTHRASSTQAPTLLSIEWSANGLSFFLTTRSPSQSCTSIRCRDCSKLSSKAAELVSISFRLRKGRDALVRRAFYHKRINRKALPSINELACGIRFILRTGDVEAVDRCHFAERDSY